MTTKPQAYIFIGRYGSGKGTQAALLMEVLKKKNTARDILYIETGKEFRKFNEGESYTAKLGKQIVDGGVLMPEFMPVYIWSSILAERYNGTDDIVFDGTPRKLMESKILESVFPFYGQGKPWVVYLDVEHDESHKRLLIRSRTSNRADDGPEQVKKRKLEYETYVVPVVDYFRTSPNVNFLDIDGEQTIDKVHEDIVKAVGLL